MSLYNKILSQTQNQEQAEDILKASYLIISIYDEHTAKKMCQEYINACKTQLTFKKNRNEIKHLSKRLKYYKLLEYAVSQYNNEKRLEKIKKLNETSK